MKKPVQKKESEVELKDVKIENVDNRMQTLNIKIDVKDKNEIKKQKSNLINLIYVLDSLKTQIK